MKCAAIILLFSVVAAWPLGIGSISTNRGGTMYASRIEQPKIGFSIWGTNWPRPDVASLDTNTQVTIVHPGLFRSYPCTLSPYAYTQPASNETFEAHVYDNRWFSIDSRVFVNTPQNGETGGWYSVVSKISTTNMTLRNLGSNGFRAAGASVRAGATVSTTNDFWPIGRDDFPSSGTDGRTNVSSHGWGQLCVNRSVASNGVNVIAIRAGDYRSVGTFYYFGTSDGSDARIITNGAWLYVLFYEPTLSDPYTPTATAFAQMEGLHLDGNSNVVVSSLSFEDGYYSPTSGGMGVQFVPSTWAGGTQEVQNVILDRLRSRDTFGQFVRLKDPKRNFWIQRGYQYRMKVPGIDNPAYYIQGGQVITNGTHENIYIVDNTVVNFTDTVQNTEPTTGGSEDYQNIVVAANTGMYNYAVRGGRALDGENFGDAKTGSTNPARPSFIWVWNTAIGYRASSTNHGSLGSSGTAFTTHGYSYRGIGSDYIKYWTNFIYDCNAGIVIKGSQYQEAIGNVFWNIHSWGPIESSSDTLVSGSAIVLDQFSSTGVIARVNDFNNVSNVLSAAHGSTLTTNNVEFTANSGRWQHFQRGVNSAVAETWTNWTATNNTKLGSYVAP